MIESIREKQTRFAKWLPRLIDKAFDLGYLATLGEAWRTPEQCAWNAEHSTGIVCSLHGERLAIDLDLFTLDGIYITDDTGHKDLGTWWVRQQPDFCWGGHFKARDNDHYSLTPDGGKTQ